ncbi:MAG: hypothetical protein WAN48_09745 [Actinomycetes bacterium]
MRSNRRRFTLVASTMAAVLVGGGIAAAYWTTTGNGSSPGSVGAGTATLTVTQDSTVSGLVPGGPAKPLDFTVSNPTSGPLQISNVGITVAVTSSPGTCTSSDFTITQPSKPSGGTPLQVPAAGSLSFTSAGGGATGGTGADIAMVNSSSDHNGCKGAVLSVTYNVS